MALSIDGDGKETRAPLTIDKMGWVDKVDFISFLIKSSMLSLRQAVIAHKAYNSSVSIRTLMEPGSFKIARLLRKSRCLDKPYLARLWPAIEHVRVWTYNLQYHKLKF